MFFFDKIKRTFIIWKYKT